MPPVNNGNSTGLRHGQIYWRSLDDLADTPQFREFMHREFPAGASELLDSNDRRHFLKIMGASMALAGLGLTGCRRWPEEKIMPFARRPEGRMPGVPVQYATSMELGGIAYGLLATTYDGRPIKVEGNPEHPLNRGRTDALMQASVLNLYDPDRSQFPRYRGERSTWQAYLDWAGDHFQPVEQQRGRTLAILSEASSSPSVDAMKRKLRERFPAARWHEYEPLNNDNEREGSIMAFGESFRTHYHLDRAKTIISLDSDFLLNHPAAVRHMRDFAKGRRASDQAKSMNRLYVCEGTFSMTGANADHRFAMRSSEIAVVAARLAAAVLGNAAGAAGNSLARFGDADLATPFVEQMAAELQQSRGECVVIAGPQQPAEVHLLAHMMNEALGNVGRTVTYTAQPNTTSHLESIGELIRAIDGGSVTTLIVIGGNPAYNAPAELDAAAKLEQLAEDGAVIHLGDYFDETGSRSTWHINRAHFLEAWGDGRADDGSLCITQPLIEPLFEGKSAIEFLAPIAGSDKTEGYDLVRETFAQLTGAMDIERLWRRTLHDGVLSGSAFTPARPRLRTAEAGQHIERLYSRWSPMSDEALELVYRCDGKVLDGRFANNGWLQELPEVMTKLTWDNAAVMNPTTAKRLGVKTGDMVRLTVAERSLDVAALVLPGHPLGTVTLALGYGREFDGRICKDAGVNAYRIRSSRAAGFAPVEVTKISGSYVLATTQDHYALDSWPAGAGKQERIPSIYREATREEFVEKGKRPFQYPPGLHVAHRLSQWEENLPFHRQGGFKGAEYAWAMSIDLSACVGCGACVVACQAENNIPIVGKDQVHRQREMHWLRIDRYFKGTNNEMPEAVALQPVPCMHCENAPCEQVCPVAATLHDEDGLNVMVYNRCIGTRYCSNNCPYKVRRFNYFDYHRREPARKTGLMHVDREYYQRPQAAPNPLQQLQFNPEVTVRSRGVMEKCTFCVQRISAAKIKAKTEWLKTASEEQKRNTERIAIDDGSFTTACAQACPAEAIDFGDLLDQSSVVWRHHNQHDRGYEMLEELNTKPRVKYLGKLRNPSAAAPVAASVTPGDQESRAHA